MRPSDQSGKEYYRCSAVRYEKGLLTPENDPLLAIMNMTWPQFKALAALPRLERSKKICELGSLVDPQWESEVFKLDPSKPFTTQLASPLNGKSFIDRIANANNGVR